MHEILNNDSLCANCKFNLCDCLIERISVMPDSVVFHFCEGFSVVEGMCVRHVHSGQVQMLGVKPDEISCWIIKRTATKRGAKLCGKPISIEELSQLMERKKLQIELFAEMYEAYRLHWRGTFHPSGHRKLSTHVVIETISEIKLEYIWG